MRVTYGKGFEVATEPTMRAKVEHLQAEISKHPQYEPKTTHTFHGGMYCRQVWCEADVTIVGKVHKTEHFFLLMSGTIRVTTEDDIQTLTGPHLLHSAAGTKRVIHCDTEVHFLNIHRVESATVEEVEAELVEFDPNSMFGVGNTVIHQSIKGA